MNKIIISGNIGKLGELTTSSNDKKYIKFSVAVNRKFNRDETDWFYCTAFGNQAEKYIAQYAKIGSNVVIAGRLEFNIVNDKTYAGLIVDDIEIRNKAEADAEQQSTTNAKNDVFDDLKAVDSSLPW